MKSVILRSPTKAAAACLLVAGLSMASFVHAQDTGTFTITGRLVPSCGFAVTDISFPLGDVPMSTFLGTGSYGPDVIADLVASGCPGVTAVKMKFEAPADANDPTTFAVTGGARGVGIELRSTHNSIVDPNGDWLIWTRRSDNIYRYKARYKSTGASLAAGDANASVIVRIEYE